MLGKPPADALHLDEDPLRKAILKGYFGERAAPLEPEPLLAHLRQLLSGPAGGPCEPTSYHFEIDPQKSVPLFLRSVEVEAKGLAALIGEPLLAAAEERAGGRRGGIAGNLAVFISSLAGSIAVKTEIREAAAGALLAGFLIVISRLGPRHARALFTAAMAPPGRPNVE